MRIGFSINLSNLNFFSKKFNITQYWTTIVKSESYYIRHPPPYCEMDWYFFSDKYTVLQLMIHSKNFPTGKKVSNIDLQFLKKIQNESQQNVIHSINRIKKILFKTDHERLNLRVFGECILIYFNIFILNDLQRNVFSGGSVNLGRKGRTTILSRI